MKRDLIRNLLAAVGAVVVALVVLSVLLTSVFGPGLTTADSVAVVRIEGVITDPTVLTRELVTFGKRDDVKAVVVRINSPGGGVGPSQEIHREIKRLREKKPVVASMGAVAASGGLYSAVGAEKIVANPGTITGSIGVIIEFMNAEELLGKIGLKGSVVKSGRYKDTGSPFREMTEGERKLLQELIDEVNSQFIDAVAEGRGLEVEDVRTFADGRVFSGAKAMDLGLVDSLGGLTDAVKLAGELAEIEGEPNVIYPVRRRPNILDFVLGSTRADDLRGLVSGLRVMYLAPELAGG